MAVINDSSFRTFKAGADLSATANLYKLVKLNSSGEVVLATAATDKIIGHLVDLGAAGANVRVRLRSAVGTSKLKAGGTVSVGDYVTANASSLAIATTTAADQIVGVAIKAADSGDIFEVMNYTGTVPA